MFEADKPFLHLHNNSKLFSKFQGPFCSTHCSWYSELNLNCKMLFPTSTICKSEPIFQVDFNVFFKALWFWSLSVRRCPKRLNEHSSSRSALLLDVMGISSSSSLVRWRLSRPSTTDCSIPSVEGGNYGIVQRERPCNGESGREGSTKGVFCKRKKLLWGREKTLYQISSCACI